MSSVTETPSVTGAPFASVADLTWPASLACSSAQAGGFGGPVFKLQYTPDGKSLVACASDKTVRVVDPSNGSTRQTLSGHADWVYTFAVSADGKTLASGGWDGEVRLWSLPDAKLERTIVAAPGLKSASK